MRLPGVARAFLPVRGGRAEVPGPRTRGCRCSAFAAYEKVVRGAHPEHVRHTAEAFFQLDGLEVVLQVRQMVRREKDVIPAKPRRPEEAAEGRVPRLARRP